ncbi:Zfp294 protein [Daldinia eschscholtzii]|nr:Zfp294 protein [Daldinia eschscholtzii]
MSRKPGKSRAAASNNTFATFGTKSFGAFSAASRGADLSYLAEPPDLSSISDANVVVSLKNLQKKDATTKAKALEELVSYVQAHPHEKDGGVEEPILEAWVQLYPRVSIENARRVRELSHILQYELMKSGRKRTERHVPKIVGTWLAGTFDRDKVVSRAAADGLSSFLTTPEKVVQFWKRCQPQILDYASGAIRETAETLSDERSTSADDAESKSYRVLGSSLALVLGLLQKLDPSDLEKYQDDYDQFFEQDKVWKSVSMNDTVVRQLSCQLLTVCLEKRPGRIEADLGRLSKNFVAEGLASNHVGSAASFVDALTELTARHPTVWTSEYRGKKSLASRLKTFLEKGSQGAGSKFWISLSRLIEIIPADILPKDLDSALDFLKSMRSGLTRREEPRSSAIDGWSTYLNTTKNFIKVMKSSEDRVKIVQEGIFPLIAHYFYPTPETSIWVSGSQVQILIKAYTSTATSPFPEVITATDSEWGQWKENFRARIRNSLPEASKEYEKSQKAIADEGDRWFTFAGLISDAHERTQETDRPIPDIPAKYSLELLEDIFKLLEARKWKPFGAAATVESAFKQAPRLFRESSATTNNVLDYLTNALHSYGIEFVQSPAAPYILSSINLLGHIPEQKQEYEKIWKISIGTLLEYIDDPSVLPALTTIISTKDASALAQQDQSLQAELIKRCLMCSVGIIDLGWDLFDAVLTFNTLTEMAATRLTKELGSRITNALGQPNPGVIKGLRLIAEKKPDLLLQDEVTHMNLMTNLLSVSERFDATSDIAVLKGLMETPSTESSRLSSLVQRSISTADSGSLTIDTIIQQVIQSSATNTEINERLESLIPDTNIWKEELALFLQETPNQSLAFTSIISSAYFLPTPTPSAPSVSLRRDRDGCSIPGRMALYITKLLSAGYQLDTLPLPKRVEIVIYLSLTVGLVTDQITVKSQNQIWSSLSSETSLSDAEELVSSARKAIVNLTEDAANWRDGSNTEKSRLMHDIIHTLLDESRPLTPMGLYHARALSELLQALAEKHGFPSSGEQWLTDLDVLKNNASTVFPAVAVLSGLGEALSTSRVINNFCNRLVSDIAGASLGQEKSLITLVLLNACTQIYDIGELPVANNRLVFAVKQITSWLDTPEDLDYRFAAEACRSLQRLLPCVKDVYGPYWEKAIDFCVYIWTKPTTGSLDYRLPEIHASLRLFVTLQSLEEPNDDLVDVLQSSSEKRSTALIELLKLPRDIDTQPLEIVDSIICRLVEKLPLHHIKDLSELYGLVASDARSIQTAAFSILHKALPAAQEDLSLDVLIEKKEAQLPDELLSLLLDAPTLEKYSDEALGRFPSPVRSYLLSWHLVFDSFKAAAFKVRSDYAENLKAANYVGPLMEFTFDVLGHSAARPLNLEKANFTKEHIKEYDIKLAEAETEERNMQWLLIHLFYLVLKYVPSLFKAWYMECRSKQTKIAVEGWMTEFFSPIIISEALDDVEKWTAAQEAPADGENELIVKVSRNAKEVTAGYEVDELQASIAIRIPQEFPLENVLVSGVNRVAVNERKWQSWIMTTQAVITFSGGSIIDGLTTFRRNIVGAMKGQTECAICYSIISSDKKTPDKRCQTCKNLFHRTCLYKWFQSSNQNTCPLCRNPIDYLGSDRRAARNT